MDPLKKLMAVTVRNALSPIPAQLDLELVAGTRVEVQPVPGRPLQTHITVKQDGKPIRFFLISVSEPVS